MVNYRVIAVFLIEDQGQFICTQQAFLLWQDEVFSRQAKKSLSGFFSFSSLEHSGL